MPLIHYSCECLYSASKFFRSPKDAPPTFTCVKCGKESKKMLRAPASTSTLIIDNGVQAKRVEVNLEVIEDIKERSTKDFREK
jgi:hypothetical protein